MNQEHNTPSIKPLDIIILAAGRGTRMHSGMPKVLHEIAGQPMLQRVIKSAQQLNPQSISVVVGFEKEQVYKAIREPVSWVEQDQQLGTGHAVKAAIGNVADNGQTLILYGDVPLINADTLRDLLAIAQNNVALLTDVLPDPTGMGRIVRDGGKIVSIVEEKDANIEQKNIQETNTGIGVFPSSKLKSWLNELQNNNAQQEYYLTDVIAFANRDDINVYPLPVSESYLAQGVNNKYQLAELERVWQLKQAHELLYQGITLRDPSRFDLRGSLVHGKDVVIDVNVVLEGDVVLGDRVVIGANCVIKNAKIGNGVVILPNSHLDSCEIDDDANIGPFARLRPNAKIGREAHVGNFVEIKNSTLGPQSKANHLTYLGDATIGDHTNIGAGTITCNYDGVNKYKTIVGDGVRIGSGNMLVAPVHIGHQATTAAGSTITSDCPAGELTIARARQVTISGWERPERNDKIVKNK